MVTESERFYSPRSSRAITGWWVSVRHANALLSLRERFWPAFDAISVLDLLRVDLGDDAAVRECAEAAIFTHGVPDILVTHSGAMPSRYAHYYAT